MGKALYRKYRSKSLDEIVGQSHITDILKRAIANGKVAHAYLLTGPKGVGKTSIARIIAHEINQLPYSEDSSHLDIIEIDAASNNSVDDVRDLREKVQIAPTSAAKKIYIIDEVHMLSKQAFNALLKTLEEPPEHVVFILATTDVDKLPATIISRVQRFNFRSITPVDAASHLRTIADTEKIDITDDALALIALHGRGSFRDSIGLLDQMQSISDSTITRSEIEQMLGLLSNDTIGSLLAAYNNHDLQTVAEILHQTEANGTPATLIAEQLIHSINQQLVTNPSLVPLIEKLLDVSKSSWPFIKLLVAFSPVVSASPLLKETKAPAPTPAPAPVPTKKPAQNTMPATTEPPQETVTLEQPTPPRKAGGTSGPQELDWESVVTAIKAANTSLHTLLNKVDYSYEDGVVTIHSGRAFYKKQLDKNLPLLASAIAQAGAPDASIVVLETTKPPSDPQTASIIAMMGGGAEVVVNG